MINPVMMIMYRNLLAASKKMDKESPQFKEMEGRMKAMEAKFPELKEVKIS